jgi:hypothetical protein
MSIGRGASVKSPELDAGISDIDGDKFRAHAGDARQRQRIAGSVGRCASPVNCRGHRHWFALE